MKRFISLFAAALLLFSGIAFGQEKFFIFPQFADGAFSDGTSYRSTLMVQVWLSTPVTCTLRLNGMTTTLGSASGSVFSISIPGSGWFQVRSNGTQAFQSGYAALTCSDYVFANVVYSYFAGGSKLGEATVFGVDPTYTFRIVADQTEGARLALAMANDTDISRNYRITLKRSDGTAFGSSTVNVGARQTLAKFLSELVPTSVNQLLEATIEAPDFSDLSVVGVRYTGPVFTTIPAN
jgi:hypothetical protein